MSSGSGTRGGSGVGTALDELTAALRDWSDHPDDVAAVRDDRSGWRPAGLPILTVRAHTVEEVQATVRFAAARGFALVTRGSGSGLTGAATAGEGVIVLDLSQLDRILEIRVDDQQAIVEAGVITAALDARAREHGLFYAPDPGSVGISTIGGNIATNAGGLRGAKYGVTRDAVLALDVVLADGELVRLGRETVKGVTGYDLTSLFVGSEGTLGVIVRAVVRLLPVPLGQATLAAFFPSIEAAAQAATAIGNVGVRPVVLEIVDGPTLAAIDDATGTSFRARGEAFLLAQTDGLAAEAEIELIAAAVAPFASAPVSASVEITTAPEVAARLLAARREALPSIEALGRVLIEDIAVPRSKLAATIRGVQQIGVDTGVRIFVFAHAGDGNIHPILLLEESGPDDPIPAAAREAADRIFALALESGGTLTGEHGIGTLKRDWLEAELGARVLEVQTAVKLALDPSRILNPGKAI